MDDHTTLHDKVSAAHIVMTTEDRGGFEIAERVSVISAQCVFGAGVFSDAFASVQNVAGGRAKTVEDTMNEATRTVFFELKKQAFALHADAVVAITVQYTPVGYDASNMIMVSATGTVVRFEA
jgi:uncharacterized protein YbjQ (UPF0145 family)